jgi:hypothetical protein
MVSAMEAAGRHHHPTELAPMNRTRHRSIACGASYRVCLLVDFDACVAGWLAAPDALG